MTTGHGISCKSAFKSTFLIEGNHCVVECDRGEEGKGIGEIQSRIYPELLTRNSLLYTITHTLKSNAKSDKKKKKLVL